MKAKLLMGSALLFVACSSSVPQNEAKPTVDVVPVAARCPDISDLRGEGVAANYQQALAIAQKSVAAQIQSTVSATSRSRVSQTEDADGKEIIQSSFDIEAKVLTRLENAQDVKVVSSEDLGDGIRVVACMSRANAMKPFTMKAQVLQDSLHLAAKAYEGTVHPIQKNKNYKTGRRIYIQYVTNRNILESFGVVNSEASAAVDADYAAMHNDFSNFLANYAMYFETPEDELSQSVFSVVSQNFSVVGGECKSGLLMKAGAQNLNCKDGSLGVKCSVTLTLTGASCEGERYFDLQADVAGSGKYDESEAMEKLHKNILKAEWFTEWRRELNRWRMK